jgi:hypothetical protein
MLTNAVTGISAGIGCSTGIGQVLESFWDLSGLQFKI